MDSRKKDVLYAIGEALIDFIPSESGCDFSDVPAFAPAVGGAPANVSAVFARLGGKSRMITQVGADPFGRKVLQTLSGAGVDTRYVFSTEEANTCLAFVALMADGNRTFSFYRKPSADMLLGPESIDPAWFDDAFALHFCAVSLGDYPLKEAHKAAIEAALSHGALISFDPNLRFPLWPDHQALYRTVWEFLPKAHVVKISDEELSFIAGTTSIEEALPKLFVGNVELILYTCGAQGAQAYTKKACAKVPGEKVQAIDTTGAGDAFAGSFLYSLHRAGVTSERLPDLTPEMLEAFLRTSNSYAAASTTVKGAIPSYPDHF